MLAINSIGVNPTSQPKNMDEDNQNFVFLEEVLELLEGILDAISIELEDIAGRRWGDGGIRG